MDNIPGLTGSAMLALLVIREVLGFLKKRNTDKDTDSAQTLASEDREALKEMHEMSKEMYRMHVQFDEDGVPKWYVRKSIDRALESIAECLVAQTKILERIENKVDSGK